MQEKKQNKNKTINQTKFLVKKMQFSKYSYNLVMLVTTFRFQSARAVAYTDCIAAEGIRP